MSTSTSQVTNISTSSSVSEETEETNIEAVSYDGGIYCYLIGGIVGQGFSAMKQPYKRIWKEDAPRWRHAFDGLNLEGICNNSSCDAYEEQVIHQWGFQNSGVFKYYENEHECKCPLCGKYVKPITCGFADCEWKVTGGRKDKEGEAPKPVDSGWQIALGNGYTTFRDSLTQLAIWDNLKIEVESLDSEKAQNQAALYL